MGKARLPWQARSGRVASGPNLDKIKADIEAMQKNLEATREINALMKQMVDTLSKMPSAFEAAPLDPNWGKQNVL